MSDATAAGPDKATGPTPDNALRDADRLEAGPVLAADGTPLKKSLRKALRAQKLRALGLIAPLLFFILITFVAPIADMLFRSVENQIVSETLPRTVIALDDWDSDGEAGQDVYSALALDLMIAVEQRAHTRLGSRLNYETTGISSLFRRSGRAVDDIGEVTAERMIDLDPAWDDPVTWATLLADPDWIADAEAALGDGGRGPVFALKADIADAFPRTADAYGAFARTIQAEGDDNPLAEEPWNIVYASFADDLAENGQTAVTAAGELSALVEQAAAAELPRTDYRAAFLDMNDDWGDPQILGTIKAFSSPYTAGYFLSSVDMQLTPQGVEAKPENQQIYGLLFQRTLFMSMVIMFSCILLGYPIAFLLSNLPLRSANMLLILVLLPFWTSLLVRTSSWKVLLQQQGVINDILVWAGLVGDGNRLIMINNQFGTIVAMTHILLPFMILPLYSVMKTIPPSYMRAAKSLGANDWTAFWRVYFPQSVPGIGAGCILVFILSIGYYITPELVGGTTGTFISNRIAYHISTSLNWGLAAALGSILLVVVIVLYWVYDRIVGIDNVSLG